MSCRNKGCLRAAGAIGRAALIPALLTAWLTAGAAWAQDNGGEKKGTEAGAKEKPFGDTPPPAKTPPAKAPADKTDKPADAGESPKSDKEPKPANGNKGEPPHTLTPDSNQPTDIKPEEDTTPGMPEFNRAKESSDAGKYDEAIDQFKKSLKLFTKDTDTTTRALAYYGLGVAYRMRNQYDDAVGAFSDGIKLITDAAKQDTNYTIPPELGDAFLRRGICWFYKDEYGLAEKDFDESAGIGSTDPKPFTWKGIALARQGKTLDAINVYSMALRFDNRFLLAHVNRGLAYVTLKDYAKAVTDFEDAINLSPREAPLYVKRGIAQGALADWPAAIKSYSEAIRLDPKYVDAYKNRAIVYQKLGDAQHAAEDEQTAKELAMAGDNGSLPEPKQPEAKEPEAKQPDAKQPEVKQPETKQPETKQPETKQPDAKKPDIKQPDAKQPDAKKSEPAKTEPKKPEAKKPAPAPKKKSDDND